VAIVNIPFKLALLVSSETMDFSPSEPTPIDTSLKFISRTSTSSATPVSVSNLLNETDSLDDVASLSYAD
ncbi:hypothetical protein A0J61_11814, partial [Choanephora cucurbitarum]